MWDLEDSVKAMQKDISEISKQNVKFLERTKYLVREVEDNKNDIDELKRRP